MHKQFLDDDDDADEDDDFEDDEDDQDDDEEAGEGDEDEDEDVETWQVLQTVCRFIPLKHTQSLTSGYEVLDWPGFQLS